MILKPKAFIFDMDGVVIDTERTKYKSLQIILKKYGIKLNKDPKLLGMSSKDLFIKLKKDYNLDYNVNDLVKSREELIFSLFSKEKIRMMPGFLRLIKSLRKNRIKIGLATSSTEKFLNFVMNKVKIKKCFDVMICGDDVRHSKPNPMIYLLAAKKLKVKPEDCIVVEDAVNGIKAAKSAGMYVIGITNTFQRKYLNDADIIVKNLDEIRL